MGEPASGGDARFLSLGPRA